MNDAAGFPLLASYLPRSDLGGVLVNPSRVAVPGGDMRGMPIAGVPQPVCFAWQGYPFTTPFQGYPNLVQGGTFIVAPGDIIVLAMLGTGGFGAIPTGWRLAASGTDANGYVIGLYWSNYSPDNAAINSTNFPYGNGGYCVGVYRAGRPLSLLQASAVVDSLNPGGPTITIPELALPRTRGSILVAWSSSRDPGPIYLGDRSGMQLRIADAQMGFLTQSLRDGLTLDGPTVLTRRLIQTYNLLGIVAEVGPTPPTALILGGYRYWRINGAAGSSFMSIAEIEYRASAGGPDLTTAGGGTPSASTTYSSSTPGMAFDNNASTEWATSGAGTGWIVYDFVSPVPVVEVSITGSGLAGRTPSSFTVETSSDGTTWTVQNSYTASWAANETKVFAVPGPAPFVNPASVFGPTDQGGWWDFTDASTLFSDAARTTASTIGGNIRGVTDKSGKGNHLGNTSGAATMQSGYASFPGTSQGLQSANISRLGSEVGHTVIAVYRLTDVLTNYALVGIDYQAGSQRVSQAILMAGSTFYSLAFSGDMSTTFVASGGTAAAGTDYLYLMTMSPAAVSIRVNRTLFTTSTTNTAGNCANSPSCPISIGADWLATGGAANQRDFKGRIYAAFEINRQLTPQERTDLENYFGAIIGI